MKTVSQILKNKYMFSAWIFMGISVLLLIPSLAGTFPETMRYGVVMLIVFLSLIVIHEFVIKSIDNTMSASLLAYLNKEGISIREQIKGLRLFMIQYFSVAIGLPLFLLVMMPLGSQKWIVVIGILIYMVTLYNYAILIVLGKRPQKLEFIISFLCVMSFVVSFLKLEFLSDQWSIVIVLGLFGIASLYLAGMRYHHMKDIETRDFV